MHLSSERMNLNVGGMMHADWRKTLRPFFATPRRALATTMLVILIILSGIIGKLVSALIYQIVVPVFVLACLIWLMRYLVLGKRPH